MQRKGQTLPRCSLVCTIRSAIPTRTRWRGEHRRVLEQDLLQAWHCSMGCTRWQNMPDGPAHTRPVRMQVQPTSDPVCSQRKSSHELAWRQRTAARFDHDPRGGGFTEKSRTAPTMFKVILVVSGYNHILTSIILN